MDLRDPTPPVWLSPGTLLDALTFDGRPFKVLIPAFKVVGCGGTAKIIVGHVVDDDITQVVAVKVFGNMLEDHHQELLIRELQTARQVSLTGHPSILPFIGSASFGLQTAIVSRYMKNGNLLEYFKAQQEVDKIDKKRLILQVAEAVNHLHTVEKLVHGDLKCANVEVSDSGDALLADFGLSTFVEKAPSCVTTAMSLRQLYTVRFAAPEIIRDVAGKPARLRSKTRESDVYAFGMLVLEAITERPPWADADEFAIMHWVTSGLKPDLPRTVLSGEWIKTCSRCWDIFPESRPPMKAVILELSAHDYRPNPNSVVPGIAHFLKCASVPPAGHSIWRASMPVSGAKSVQPTVSPAVILSETSGLPGDRSSNLAFIENQIKSAPRNLIASRGGLSIDSGWSAGPWTLASSSNTAPTVEAASTLQTGPG